MRDHSLGGSVANFSVSAYAMLETAVEALEGACDYGHLESEPNPSPSLT